MTALLRFLLVSVDFHWFSQKLTINFFYVDMWFTFARIYCSFTFLSINFFFISHLFSNEI